MKNFHQTEDRIPERFLLDLQLALQTAYPPSQILPVSPKTLRIKARNMCSRFVPREENGAKSVSGSLG